MKLRKISVEAFRSFKEPSSTGILPGKGLGLIRGTNLDTGGSSGAGKSSLALAVAHALKFCQYPATSLQSWLTDQKMQVDLELELPDGRLAILRVGKTTSIQVEGEVETKGSAVAVQERVQQLTGLTPELLKHLTYRPQKTPGLFLSMTNSEKQEFLSTLLGLEELEGIADAARERAKLLEKKADEYDAVSRSLQEQIADISIPAPPPAPSKSNVDELTKNVQLLEESMNETRTAISEAEKTLSHENAKRKEDREVVIAELVSQHAKIRGARPPFVSTISERLTSLKSRRDELQNKIETEIKLEQEERRKLNEEALNGNRIILDLQSVISSELQVSKLAEEVEKQITISEKAACPTCEQSWVSEQAKEHLSKLRVKLSELEVKREEIAVAKRLIEPAKEYLAEVRGRADGYKSETLATLREEKALLESELAKTEQSAKFERQEYDQKHREEDLALSEQLIETEREHDKVSRERTETLRENIATHNMQWERSHGEWQTASAILAAEKDRVAKEALAIQTATIAMEQAQKQKEELEGRLQTVRDAAAEDRRVGTLEADFAAMVGREGFMGSIFEEVLVEVSDEANKLLGELPNTATTTIEFVTETETKKGTTRRSITPIVTKGGTTIPLESGLSGGQLTSAELAVDLAVMTVIGRRTGRMPGWLILDESFGDGHDVPVMEACLEILRRAAEDRLIILVSHATELKDQIEFTIDVESSGDQSRIIS